MFGKVSADVAEKCLSESFGITPLVTATPVRRTALTLVEGTLLLWMSEN
jgi:hypothetical protein